MQPVSYTHLDVYKRQVDNRGKLILENVYLYTFSPGGTATIENKSGGTAEITGDCRIIRD